MSALAVPFPQQTVASIHFFGRIEEKTIRQNERGPGRVSFGFQFFAVYPPRELFTGYARASKEAEIPSLIGCYFRAGN